MSERDDEMRVAAKEYAAITAELNAMDENISALKRRRDEKVRDLNLHAKTLMQHVGRNIDELHIRVEDEMVHVKWHAEQGPSVRLVKVI